MSGPMPARYTAGSSDLFNFENTTYTVGGGVEGYLMEDSTWISSKLEYLYVGLDLDRPSSKAVRENSLCV